MQQRARQACARSCATTVLEGSAGGGVVTRRGDRRPQGATRCTIAPMRWSPSGDRLGWSRTWCWGPCATGSAKAEALVRADPGAHHRGHEPAGPESEPAGPRRPSLTPRPPAPTWPTPTRSRSLVVAFERLPGIGTAHRRAPGLPRAARSLGSRDLARRHSTTRPRNTVPLSASCSNVTEDRDPCPLCADPGARRDPGAGGGGAA